MTDRDAAKAARRSAACVNACAGLPTETLERIAELPTAQRPAALAEAARRNSLKRQPDALDVVRRAAP